MSDFKAAFRQAAQSQKVLSKEQIKALKAKKLAEKEASDRASAAAAAARSMPPPPAPARTSNRGGASAGPGPGSAAAAAASSKQAGLPSDFFDTKPATTGSTAAKSAEVGSTGPQRQGQAAPAQPDSGPQPSRTIAAAAAAATARPVAAAAAPTAAAAAVPGAATAVPAGFFDDKKADAKARGIKLPDKADKEEAFKAFQQEVDEQLKEDAAVEAVEAEEEAQARQEREEFEQFMLEQHVEELRALKGQKRPAIEVDEAILAAVPRAKRRRPMDVLAQLEGEDGSGDEDEDADGVLDWRAKGM